MNALLKLRVIMLFEKCRCCEHVGTSLNVSVPGSSGYCIRLIVKELGTFPTEGGRADDGVKAGCSLEPWCSHFARINFIWDEKI